MSALWGGRSAVATRSRRRKAHLRPVHLCSGEPAAPRDSAERCPSPAPTFHPPTAWRPRCHRRCSRGKDRRATLNCGGAGPTRSRGRSHRRPETTSGERGDVVLTVWHCCVSLGVGVVVVATVKREDVSPLAQCSINDASEEPLCLRRWIRQNCTCYGSSPTQETDLDFTFSTCDDVIPSTSAARSDWRQCPLSAEAFA